MFLVQDTKPYSFSVCIIFIPGDKKNQRKPNTTKEHMKAMTEKVDKVASVTQTQ